MKLIDHPPQSSPHSTSNKIEIDDLDDEPSELGEDVCLEYTDFGQDLGFPVTWSESEYGQFKFIYIKKNQVDANFHSFPDHQMKIMKQKNQPTNSQNSY
jgi:hypothetical protein